VLRLAVVVIAGVLACAALVRYSPGFGSEEADIDARLSRETALAIHRRADAGESFPEYAAHYFRSAAHGDFGISRTFNSPVSDLLRERASATAALMISGIALAWTLGLALAWMAAWRPVKGLRAAAEILAGISLAVPPAVIAIVFFLVGAPLSAALALAILPRIFGTIRELLEDAWRSPALVCARARGLSRAAVAFRYVALPMAPQLAALAGVSVVLAFGSAIPVEALCDVAGIGQLAWRAALGRDLPLLCGLALVITFTVALAQAGAELFGGEDIDAPGNVSGESRA
jgi:ABC-type dipeptide/oligopeptide/nickel transport system permease component